MIRKLFTPAAVRVHQADLIDLVDKTGESDLPRWWAGVAISHWRREERRRECPIDSRCYRRNWSKCWECSCCENTGYWSGSDGGAYSVGCSNRQRGSGARFRWVLPDEDKSAHQDAEPKHSTTQTAE